MKIIYDRETKIAFSEIEVGGVFSCEGDIGIKTEDRENAVNPNRPLNTLHLNTYSIGWTALAAKVIYYPGSELIIK